MAGSGRRRLGDNVSVDIGSTTTCVDVNNRDISIVNE